MNIRFFDYSDSNISRIKLHTTLLGKYSYKKSLFNQSHDKKEDIDVIHLNKIDVFEEEFREKGIMTATLCYFITEILKSDKFANNNIELQLISRSFPENIDARKKVYKRIIQHEYPKLECSRFQVLFANNRDEDIKYYSSLYGEKGII